MNNEQFRCELSIVKGLIESIDLFKQNQRLNDLDNSIILGKRLIAADCESSLNEWLKTRNDFQSLYLTKLILDTINCID